MNCYSNKVKWAVSFGIGLLIATILPTKWVLIVAAATLVFVGISCIRR